MSDHPSLDTIARIHANNEMVPTMMRYWDLLMIFESITLTLSHPNMTEYNKDYYKALAEQFEMRLKEEFPELTPLLRMCWNRNLSMTDDPALLRQRQDFLDRMSARYKRKTGRK